jgi:nicotinamide-nucleotide amidase
LPANINPQIQSPHLFLLPGPPRELQPMFRAFVTPILRSIVPASALIERRLYKIADKGESQVEEAIGERVLAIPGVELGYCARPGEVDVRIVGKANAIQQADAIIKSMLGRSIFSTANETLEEVIVKLLAQRNQTLAVAESCTGGLLANRVTNVPGASGVFLAGYVCYANQAKIGMLNIDPQLIEKHGAVSEQVARALAEQTRARSGSDYALATTGIAGPGGGSPEKPVGTVYIALAATGETVAKRFFFPTDRETFKEVATQAALELLRRRLIAPT